MSTVFRIPILVTVWRCLTFPYSRCGLFGGFWLRTPRCSSLLVTASFKDPQSRSSAAPASIRNVHWHHHIPRPKEQPKMGTWNQAIPSNDHKTEWLESRSWKPSKSTGQVFQTTSSFLPNLEIVAVESFPLKEPMPMCTTCCLGPKNPKIVPSAYLKATHQKKLRNQIKSSDTIWKIMPDGLPIWEVIQFLNPPILPRIIQGSSRHMSFCATERRSLMMVLKGNICHRLIDGAMGYRNIG